MAAFRKPRRVIPTLNLFLISLRTRRRLAATLLGGVLALFALFRLLTRERRAAEAGVAKRAIAFDRERDQGSSSDDFPPLEELVDRDRMWPPDLSEYALSCWGWTSRMA